MDIYREELLDHYREPRNWGIKNNEGLVGQGVNQLCGDEVTVQVFLDPAPRGVPGGAGIKEMRFEGHGCAISRAACSVVSEFIKDKSVNEVEKLNADDVQRLLGVKLPPRRWACALLGLETVQKLMV